MSKNISTSSTPPPRPPLTRLHCPSQPLSMPPSISSCADHYSCHPCRYATPQMTNVRSSYQTLRTYFPGGGCLSNSSHPHRRTHILLQQSHLLPVIQWPPESNGNAYCSSSRTHRWFSISVDIELQEHHSFVTYLPFISSDSGVIEIDIASLFFSRLSTYPRCNGGIDPIMSTVAVELNADPILLPRAFMW